jgi:hypothetical protein
MHRDILGRFCPSPSRRRHQRLKEAWIMRNREAAAALGKPRVPSTWHWSRDGLSAACGQAAHPEQLASGSEFMHLEGCPGCQALWLASPEWQAIRSELMQHVDEHAEARGFPRRER